MTIAITDRMRTLLGTMLAGALVSHAAATEIKGIDPLKPMKAQVVRGFEEEGALQIELKDGGSVSVKPWPAQLPDGFGEQRLSATRMLHPAGPQDRLELRHRGARDAWLVVLANARIGSRLVGEWTLQRDGTRWLLDDGKTVQPLGPAYPATLSVNNARWCIHLLDSGDSIPPQPGVAREGEPMISLAAIRGTQARCRSASASASTAASTVLR